MFVFFFVLPQTEIDDPDASAACDAIDVMTIHDYDSPAHLGQELKKKRRSMKGVRGDVVSHIAFSLDLVCRLFLLPKAPNFNSLLFLFS